MAVITITRDRLARCDWSFGGLVPLVALEPPAGAGGPRSFSPAYVRVPGRASGSMEFEDSTKELPLEPVGNVDSSTSIEPGEPKAQEESVQPRGMTPEIKQFIVTSICYLVYTLTDGALRLIVLFNANALNFSAMQIAIMFTLYEFCGMATNLLGGILGSRAGLKVTLLSGLTLQITAMVMLCFFDQVLLVASTTGAMIFVMFAQSLAGVAKDLVKLSGKSSAKLSTNESDRSRLLKFVSWLTGAKNTVKGIGFFVGSVLFNYAGYLPALGVLIAFVFVVIPPAVFLLPQGMGKSKNRQPVTLKQVFKKNYNLNVLSLARMFLFGSRDIWFEIVLPMYMRDALGWDTTVVGAFLAAWQILYGAVQSSTPRLVLRPLKCDPPASSVLAPWTLGLSVIPGVIALSLTLLVTLATQMQAFIAGTTATLVIGLFFFAIVFAINSALHSYLVLVYTDKDKVAMNVGFYYMSNALGRLIGVLCSGALYTYTNQFSLVSCLWVSFVFSLTAGVVSKFLKPYEMTHSE